MLRPVVPIMLLVTAFVSGSCRAMDDQPKASSQPAASTTPGKSTSGNAKVDQILDRLESKGKAIKGLACKIDYRHVVVDPVQDLTAKEGELLFARGEPNSRFLVHFSKLRAAGVVRDVGEHFAFDGQWLIERNDKSKTIIKREATRPGETQDPFEIGKGPFPLPFGQKREAMLSQFKIELADFILGDPRNTDHLHCVPLPNTNLAAKYKRVEMFIDRTLELPVRIVTERVEDDSRIEVDFKDVDISAAPAGSRFKLDEPKDFTVSVEPLDPAAAQPPK
ncbi:MAG: hypothetical protein HZA51_18420 [Planctomycetes bacterium]|nr:hypothetical protein [Planctomycetota bacterium]